jgi:3-phenylpropionate/trans-cinnamate dioxygenase ferredoxin reductase subunit
MAEKIVIIGAGQAGLQAAASLRQEGYAGAITLIGEEPHLPYQRPPLSKAYLEGALDKSRLVLKPAEFYAKERIDLRTGERITAIDRARKSVVLASGEALSYDRLLIATGAPPRRLNVPGAELAGVASLRTIADSDALRPALQSGKRLVIVGAGYIGLEVAAVARKKGLPVTILELADRCLTRVAGVEISRFFHELHRDAGVDLKLGASLQGFAGKDRLEAAIADGEAIACGAALVSVGAAPATSLAEAAGLKVDNGVWVDETARTEDPAIWAAGDCTNFPSPIYGRRMRLESVPNAIDQAKAAAANMAGRRALYDAVPWFWSDQYDVKLQTAGVADGADERLARGDPRGRRYAVWYFREGRLIAVDAVNDPASFLAGKRLIAAKAAPDRKTLADPAADLKPLLA